MFVANHLSMRVNMQMRGAIVMIVAVHMNSLIHDPSQDIGSKQDKHHADRELKKMG
jgi:hypothetical protein